MAILGSNVANKTRTGEAISDDDEGALENGGGLVVVHCASGISWSVAVCCDCLLLCHGGE